MSQNYQVLARKYRPKNFHELVGQTHVSKALINAIDHNRLHHAYLFTGTRGVGKTTIARILSKCLNCETGVTSQPCGVCSSCVAIDEGRFIDLIEIDAASRTKVEDTRELIDNVPYAPTQGRYKVYLIDEVHMLSTHSFNALLKTLEEPPEHVKFLLATTDPQKLPITIISRCLQFVLRPLPQQAISDHLQNLLTQESVKFTQPALWQIANAAKGSVRDALSLTDQAIAFGQGELTDETVNEMLGLIDSADLISLISDIYQGNTAAVSVQIEQMRAQLVDASSMFDGLAELLHQLAITQLLPNVELNVNEIQAKNIHHLARKIGADVLQLYYQIVIQGREQIKLANTPLQALEMCLLRLLAFRPLAINEVKRPTVIREEEQTQIQTESSKQIPLSEVGISTVKTSAVSSLATSESSEDNVEEIQPSNNSNDKEAADDVLINPSNEQIAEQETAYYIDKLDPNVEVKPQKQNSSESHAQLINNDVDANQSLHEKNDVVNSEKDDENEINSISDDINSFNTISNPEDESLGVFTTNPNNSANIHIDVKPHNGTSPTIESSEFRQELTHSANILATQVTSFDNGNELINDVVSHKQDINDLKSNKIDAIDSVNTDYQADKPQTLSTALSENEDPRTLLECQPVVLEGEWSPDKWDYWLYCARQSNKLAHDELALARQGVMTGAIKGDSQFKVAFDTKNIQTIFKHLAEHLSNEFGTNVTIAIDNSLATTNAEALPQSRQDKRTKIATNRAKELLMQTPVMQQLIEHSDAVITNLKLLPSSQQPVSDS